MGGSTTRSKLKVRLLGSLAIERDGRPLELPQSRKARALLGLLAVTGKPQRRERLCHLFWELPDDPKGALRWSLSRLRPLVDDGSRTRLVADRQTAALDLSDVENDLALVRDAAREADTASLDVLRRAGDALEGVLLEGLDLPESHEYQAWLVAERETARLAGKRVLFALVARTTAEPETAIAYARALVTLAPEDEAAHVALVSALAAAGRRTEAERQAEIAAARLTEHGTPTSGAVAGALCVEPTLKADIVVPAKLDKPSIAVLAFSNTGATVDDYFAEGMADAITDALSRYGWLFVIARQSAFAFKPDADPRAVAQALGVRYVLTGSVMRGMDCVRIACRLIDGETNGQIWLERFDRDAGDLFALQDDVSAAVAARLEPRILEADAGKSRRKPTQSLDAYDYYLRALQLTYRPPGNDRAEAFALYEEALRRDPEFASAMVMLAYLRLQHEHYVTPEGRKESARLARRAAQLCQDDARILALAGFIVGFGAHDFDTADVLIDRALAVNQNSYWAWLLKGWGHSYWGDIKMVDACLDVAERLNPRDPFAYLLKTGRAWAAFQMGHFEKSQAYARAAAEANPAFEACLRFLAASLAELGRVDEAREALVRLHRISPYENRTYLRASLPFRPQARSEGLFAALARAGMPEQADT